MNKLEKLENLMKLLDEQDKKMSMEDFVKAFENVVNLIKQIQEKNNEEMAVMKEMFTKMTEAIKSENTDEMGSAKREMMDYCMAEMKKIKSGKDGRDGRDGADADEDAVAQKASNLAITAILPKLPKLEDLMNELPKAGANIASALELLPEGEKLKIDAIEDLEKLLEELKNRKTIVGGGGGFSNIAMNARFIDDESPTNSGDDINFTISHAPSPVSSLKVYRGGARQRITEDYTFSGRTLTLINPLVTGEILLVDFRI